jgi:hypothetical protein
MDHLSVYEMEQIRAIAAWKSEQPSVLGSLVGGMFGPVKPWVARTVPPSVIEQAVTELTTVGAIEEGRAEVAYLAKISDVRQLRFSPMRECDSLAARITMTGQRDQVVQGSSRHLARPGGRQSSFPLPLVMAVRFICRVGHCYGYTFDLLADRLMVLTILGMAAEESPPVGPEWVSVEPTSSRHIEFGHGRPGDVTALLEPKAPVHVRGPRSHQRLVLDQAFLNRVEVAARRAIQERWLVDNGKAESIAPATPRRRSAIDDLNRAISETAYIVGDAIGFGAVFPVVVLYQLLGRGEHACARGVRDGARSAVNDADQFLAGLFGREPPGTETPPTRAFRPLLP